MKYFYAVEGINFEKSIGVLVFAYGILEAEKRIANFLNHRKEELGLENSFFELKTYCRDNEQVSRRTIKVGWQIDYEGGNFRIADED